MQSSYAKFSRSKINCCYKLWNFLERKTIVFDIDETLVYAAHNQSEMPLNSIDTTIRIKVNKYGGA